MFRARKNPILIAVLGFLIAMVVVWAAMQFSPVGASWRESQYKQNIASIQWPLTPTGFDALLDKYKKRTITPEEATQLKEICISTASKIEAIVYRLSNEMPPPGHEESHHQLVHDWSVRAQKLRGTANRL